MEGDIVILNQLTTDGFSDGECITCVPDIEQMFCDSEDDRALGVLNGMYIENCK